MDWKQALKNLREAAEAATGNYQTHAILQESLKTISNVILGYEKEKLAKQEAVTPAPEAPPSA